MACDNIDGIDVDNTAAPITVDLSAQNLFLDHNFPNNPALTVSWSSAGYSVPVEINYNIEVSADEAFTTPYKLGNVTGSTTSVTYTTTQVNNAAQSVNLPIDQASKLYIRVISYLGDSEMLSKSNVTSIMVTPYKLAFPTFYLVGAASYVGWNANQAQVLFKKDNMSYIYTYMEVAQNFRFLGQQDWNPINYSIDAAGTDNNSKYFKQVSTNIGFGDHENMAFSGVTGIYKLSIDATTGVQSLSATASSIPEFDIPQVYIVGSVAGNGWSAENAIAMTKTGTGIFEYTTTLAADTEFKFLGQKSFGSLEWGNILKDNDGFDGFLGPKDDNSNIKFVGDGSTYKITVNIKAGIYTIIKQ
ncbi:hypothetical protein J2X97_000463 [Epilithonimonas hungarica]|uniref:SusE domain-containing protein n=1 Tax=Epilithonimonas hungarica TaxID=454006 RepID=UPI002784ED9F|nr:SusE domain-containing protein [Epilithonimonas hungarica]MDP9954826.1 hypothetical protein [Epilithonimonas hungarica]